MDQQAPAHSYAIDLYRQLRYSRNTLGMDELLDNELDFTRPEQRGPGPKATPTLQKRFAAAEATLAKETIGSAVDAALPTLDQQAGLALQGWHNSLSVDGRTAFLSSKPCSWQSSLTNPALGFAMRRLLRIPLIGCKGKCACGKALDPYGDHADSCYLLVGMRTRRHNIVNDEGCMAPARQAGLTPTAEEPGLVEDSNGRPADT